MSICKAKLQALSSSQQRCTSQEAPPWSVSSQWSLFQSMWDKQQLAREFWDATTVVHTCNHKGNHQSSDNRGISHLSIADKILAWVLHNRLLTHLQERVLSGSQCGFRAGWESIDMIFAASRSKREKYVEQNRDLYKTFLTAPRPSTPSVGNDSDLWRRRSIWSLPGD